MTELVPETNFLLLHTQAAAVISKTWQHITSDRLVQDLE